MARRAGWLNLGESQRRRYERAGITQSSYEAGVPLRAARGHARTPERPGQGILRPEFTDYYGKRPGRFPITRRQLNRSVQKRVTEVFGNRHKFRHPHDIDKSPLGYDKSLGYEQFATDAQIRDMLNMSDDEIEALAEGSWRGDDEWWILWYHAD